MKKYYIAFGLVAVVVLAAVIYGFSVTGSPGLKHAIQMDSTRMQNFSTLSYSINSYYSLHGRLPHSLLDVSAASYSSKDPETGKVYDYEIPSETVYKLCTTFSEDSSKEKNKSNVYYDDFGSSTKTHKKGFDCVTYEIPLSYQERFNPPPPIYYSPQN